MKRTLAHAGVCGALAVIGGAACEVSAQSIATDGSVGPATVLSGPAYDIPQALGRVSGQNLFHSFERFGLASGEAARFTTVDPRLANVLARVTGGQPSTIAGTLSLQALAGGQPNLFLINPAGVVFAAGAAIDVPGAFHVSTADAVRFADGDFAADATRPSVFSSAAPEAFGFLGDHSATLRFDGAVLLAPGAFDAVAGRVELSQGGVVAVGDVHLVAHGAVAGDVALEGLSATAAGEIVMAPGGLVGTLPGEGRDGGAIQVSAGVLQIDGDPATFTAIVGQTGSAGSGGAVNLLIGGALQIRNGGFVGTRTLAAGSAGMVEVRAGSLLVDGGEVGIASLASEVSPGASGDAGAVRVRIDGAAELMQGGTVRASTLGSGRGGDVLLESASLLIDGGPVGSAGVQSRATAEGDAGNVTVVVEGASTLRGGAVVSSSTFGSGDAGAVGMRSGALRVDGEGRFASISSDVAEGASGQGGAVNVEVDGILSLRDAAFISASTFGAGRGGQVRVRAGSLEVDGAAFGAAGILSDTNQGAAGAAGNVDVEVTGRIWLLDAGLVSSSTFSAADAGSVRVRAGELNIAGPGAAIQSNAGVDSSGRAGRVEVDIDRGIVLTAGGRISSRSFGTGDAGAVDVRGGQLDVVGDDQVLSGVLSSTFDSDGAGGAVTLHIEGLTRLENGGEIRTSTDGAGPAGDISLTTGRLRVDGGEFEFAGLFSDANSGSGRVTVSVIGDTELRNGGFVSSDTTGAGNGGSIVFRSGSMSIGARGEGLAGLLSGSHGEAKGAGGDITLIVDDMLRVESGGTINASTFAAGAAGMIDVSAGVIRVDGTGEIAARAASSSSGQPGDVTLRARSALLMDRGLVTIDNAATVADPAAVRAGRLRIEAPRIDMRSGAVVSAEAGGNAPAGSIEIAFSDWLSLDFAAISTEALDGNGGPIRVDGDGAVILRDGAIATSVFGVAGDGGNIEVDAGVLVLGTGFVQANTAATDARGGDVAIRARQVVPSYAGLQVGGDEPLSFFDLIGLPGFNAIQAAAPTGVSGRIQVPAAVLDVAGALTPLRAPAIDLGDFARDPCRRGRGNRFAVTGSGGAPVLPGAMLRAVPGDRAATGLRRHECAPTMAR